jgi:GT2 family glycosyltransferase
MGGKTLDRELENDGRTASLTCSHPIQPVAVVIVTWDSAAVIDGCLRSAVAECPAEIVVVDNGSRDHTLARVRAVVPKAHIIGLETNCGFARGCNIGVANTSAPYILFLNDDARLEPGYLDVLVRCLEVNPQAASVTGKLVWGRGVGRWIDSAGITMRFYALRPDDRGHGEIDRGQYDEPSECFGPSGAAALYRREALRSVGPEVFDEDLFAYFEDVDLAWRLRRTGWRHLYEPRAVAHHRRRGADEKPTPIAARAFFNRYLVWLKNESFWRFCLYAPMAIPWESLRLLRMLRRHPAFVSELVPSLCRIPTALRKRQRIVKPH